MTNKKMFLSLILVGILVSILVANSLPRTDSWKQISCGRSTGYVCFRQETYRFLGYFPSDITDVYCSTSFGHTAIIMNAKPCLDLFLTQHPDYSCLPSAGDSFVRCYKP